ncbi:M23 family metallopeptidase [Nitratiruptor sp. YY09-18]|uniref:M23 family metallopeptidase n=1 Tax=Nitratiruptor sp. YY09-18 TaxID=2724901 RepID=UPI0019165DFD|nr:M23 family metallopeptidase [Nitratiruptor sp. YY09-18]BCD67573.1 peptidase, M23/M37 family [Nitratiruptor sp. YY09-18]
MRRKSKKGIYLFVIILLAIGAGVYALYTSQSFERESPKIAAPGKIYWNLKKPLTITITDNSGIKEYQAVLHSGSQSVTLEKQMLSNPQKKVMLQLKPPSTFEPQSRSASIEISAVDKSLWKFSGNRAKKTIQIVIDTKKPNLSLVDNSYSITKGGSALVVFYCKDPNLDQVYIATNFGKKFYAEPFYKDGYYIALIAWPVMQESFRADIIAFDKAGNKARSHVPLYLKNRRYKTSKINLKKSFLEGKVEDLAVDFPKTRNMSPIEKFKYVNETVRQMNEKLIHTLTAAVPKERINGFTLRPFYPLKNAAPVASFGTHRYYYYNGKLVSESYHLGLDLASVRRAPIKASNRGDVVFADYNGIYGNMPIISHGLGLYTLYGHCSTVLVKKGESVARGETIAKTGNTGLALGDHLHFGILVQGVEVRPEEWMDARWIKANITDVIKEAKKIIDQE